MKSILITGAKGFIGKNLTAAFKEKKDCVLFLYDTDNPASDLEKFIYEADIIFHLAGVNRPKEESEFMTGNLGTIESVIKLCEKNKKLIPIVLTS